MEAFICPTERMGFASYLQSFLQRGCLQKIKRLKQSENKTPLFFEL